MHYGLDRHHYYWAAEGEAVGMEHRVPHEDGDKDDGDAEEVVPRAFHATSSSVHSSQCLDDDLGYSMSTAA